MDQIMQMSKSSHNDLFDKFLKASLYMFTHVKELYNMSKTNESKYSLINSLQLLINDFLFAMGFYTIQCKLPATKTSYEVPLNQSMASISGTM